MDRVCVVIAGWLAGLVSYQGREANLVCRVKADKTDGNVTVFTHSRGSLLVVVALVVWL